MLQLLWLSIVRHALSRNQRHRPRRLPDDPAGHRLGRGYRLGEAGDVSRVPHHQWAGRIARGRSLRGAQRVLPRVSGQLPVLDGIGVGGPLVGQYALMDLRILSVPVALSGNCTFILGCRFDSGLALAGGTSRYVQSCLVYGNLSGWLCGGDVGRNTVIGGTLGLLSSCGTVLVHDNAVLGPANVGIQGSEDIWIRDNYVRGCVVGIRKTNWIGTVERNVVEDCSGAGYEFLSQDIGPVFAGNVARRCGGRGFDITRTQRVHDNVAEDSGLEGVSVQQIVLRG